MKIIPETRAQELELFLNKNGWGKYEPVFLAGDCSFRRYYRLGGESSGRIILMDAPPPEEQIHNFIHIAKLLESYGYSVPEIIAWNERGFALIEDFGDQTFSRALAAKIDPYTLYELAVDFIIDLQQKFKPHTHSDLPHYTKALYTREHDLFIDWYYPAIFKHPLDAKARELWNEAWAEVLAPILLANNTLVLRDFHVDNLIYLKDRSGIQQCGLLDFQDAVMGPRAYDLVSLLEDGRHDVPPELQKKMIERYLNAFPDRNRDDFYREYFTCGAQRTTKIFGIFTRLAFRERNFSPRYLPYISRLWRLLHYDLQHPHLQPIKEWMNIYFPKEMRRVPDGN